MANFHSPNVTTNGLVLCLDAANKQSYNAEHNLMFYSGLQGASGATLPTGYTPAQYMASTIAPSNNTSITVDGVGYWQFDLVGTTPAGNTNQLLIESTLMTGIKPATSYTITYNYAFLSSANISGDGISRNYADIGGITVYVFWYDTNNTLLSVSSQNNDSYSLSFWQRSSATGKSSYTAVAPANAVKAKLRFTFYNPVAGGTAINWVGFRLGGIQVEERNASGTYVATTATQVLPTTVWKDLSGNGRNGTLTNGPTYSSLNGGYFNFDGTNDFVQCTGSITVTAATFITWIRRNGSQFFDGILFSRGTSITGMNFLSSNDFGYHWNGNSNTYFWNSGLVVPDLTWCMIAISVTSTSATGYLCQSSGITSATNTVNHTSTILDDIKIARDEEVSSRHFNGAISSAMIYNRALSAAEIQQNFNALRGRFGL